MQHHLSECCGAAKQVWERAAVSYESQAAYYKVLAQQTWEQLEAVQARRSRPVLTELATFELQLPDGWEQDPPTRRPAWTCAAAVLRCWSRWAGSRWEGRGWCG
jgi:hypothetical protein